MLNQPVETSIEWVKSGFFDKLFVPNLQRLFPGPLIVIEPSKHELAIRTRLKRTGQKGKFALWEGYGEAQATRRVSAVSSNLPSARFFTKLTEQTKPDIIVEFGTALGVSGMYWLAGLKDNNKGKLYTFEVNESWAEIAKSNLMAISPRFRLTTGLFEDKADEVLAGKLIDICLIDGVHTSEWVRPQFEIVYKKMRPGGIIILDDITFSDDMLNCWQDIIASRRVKRAAIINHRVGLVQV